MDDKKEMPRELISGLFSQGLMGIEIPSTYGGAGMSFLASCLAVEEMAKVDASVVRAAECSSYQSLISPCTLWLCGVAGCLPRRAKHPREQRFREMGQ
jgi:alkylation response protein AidB-like acyl-CoA dehydrogenase